MRLSKGDETLEIGLRLEDVRKNLGYSQRMMANELDVSVQQYQKYISGESTISADRLLMLYKKTPFDVKYVITGEKEEDSKAFTFVLSTYSGKNRDNFLKSMWMYLQKITSLVSENCLYKKNGDYPYSSFCLYALDDLVKGVRLS